ncbi:MAG: hypothetical protein J6W62_03815 [Spirochaetia bacterium]|nr:hypothetical protein [Spirochaetia bacterium]MBO7430703.1 hypothetical protein [Spirochaetia bacterium]
MVEFEKFNLTKEQLEKAMRCKTVDELVALAKTGGFEITKDQAEAFMAELADFELDNAALEKIAGGIGFCYMIDGCAEKCGLFKTDNFIPF